MALPDWTKRDGAPSWNKLRLQDRLLPGIVRIDVNCDSGLDVQKPVGGGKARVVDNGTPPIVFDVEHELTPDEAEDLRVNYIDLLRPKKVGKSREAVSVVHPLALFWGVNAISVGKISNKTPRAGSNLILNYQLIEWVPQPKKLSKPKNKPEASSGFAAKTKETDEATAALNNEKRAKGSF